MISQLKDNNYSPRFGLEFNFASVMFHCFYSDFIFSSSKFMLQKSILPLSKDSKSLLLSLESVFTRIDILYFDRCENLAP